MNTTRPPKKINILIVTFVLFALSGLACFGGGWQIANGQTAPGPVFPNASPGGVPDAELSNAFNVIKRAEPTSVQSGQSVRFTLVISNRTQSEITALSLIDEVPSQFEVTEVNTQKGSATRNVNRVTISLPTLAPGERVTITITTNVKQTEQLISVNNLASFSYTQDGKNYNGQSNPAKVNINLPNALPATGTISVQSDLMSVIGWVLLSAAALCLLLAVFLLIKRVRFRE